MATADYTVRACEQKGADKLGYEAEAFAIYDTMKYIKPPVHTLCVGTAFGESAMLLASGTPVRNSAVDTQTCLHYWLGLEGDFLLAFACAERRGVFRKLPGREWKKSAHWLN